MAKTSTDDVGIAVVGLGEFGLRYVHAFAGLTGARVLWGCDLDDTRHPAAAAAGAEATTTSLEEVLADSRVDAVAVLTPEGLHREISVAASAAGKHVIVEKPMATKDQDAAAMIAAAAQAGRLLLPAFLLRFDLRYARLAERLPEIGTVRNIYAYRNFDRSLFQHYNRTHSFVENAIHDIDLIRWFVGDSVASVHGFTRTTSGDPNPDINWGVIEFEQGALAVLQTSWLYPEQAAGELQWNAGIQVMGDRGVLEVRSDADGFRVNTAASGLRVLDQSAWGEVHGDQRGAFGAMARHFVACIRGETTPKGASAEDAREATRIALELIASAGSGSPRGGQR